MEFTYDKSCGVMKYTPSIQDLSKAINTAYKKAKHTINVNQNGVERSQEEKIDKQLQGILSEIAVQKYLDESFGHLNNVDIIRYDEVRTDDFKSSFGEFDIKINIYDRDISKEYKNIKKSFNIEVRSSRTWSKCEDKNFKLGSIIGPYTHKFKRNESLSDFYIKPVVFKGKNKKSTLLEAIENNEASFYISGGCSVNKMMNHSYEGSLGQSTTKYQLVDIKSCEDTNILSFFDNLICFIEKLSQVSIIK